MKKTNMKISLQLYELFIFHSHFSLKIFHFFIFCFLFFFCKKSFSQENINDTLILEEFIFLDKKVSDKIGFKITKFEKIIINDKITENLSELLSENSNIFIKSYGNGRISTASFRGAGASHTKVLWNGININSVMLGQVNFSQIPNYFIDEISLYHSGSIFNNSGSLGGSIFLENKINWNNNFNFDFSQEFASFQTYNSFLSFSYGNKKFQSRTRIIYEISENNFSFEDNFGEQKIQENNNFFQKGILQEFYLKNNNNYFSLKFWAQNNKNQIPPSEKEIQKQDILRFIFEWKNYMKKLIFKTKIAYTYDFMNYKNENNIIKPINSNNLINSFYNFFDINYNFNKNLKLKTGINLFYHQVETGNYKSIKERVNLSSFLGINYFFFKKLQTSFFIKKEIIDENFSPLIPSMSFNYKIFENKKFEMDFKCNFTRNYNYPTLNDLYWFPNGNANLKAENGFSYENGIFLKKNFFKNMSVFLETTYFYSKINDWILWNALNSEIWTPENLKKVERKGIENSLKIDFKIKNLNIFFKHTNSYVNSKNLKKFNDFDNSLNKQLIYVPKFIFNNFVHFSYKNNYISYSNQFSDLIYTSSDNENFLPSYFISNLKIGKKFIFKKFVFLINFKIKNLFNENYQVVENYPMQKRNFHFILQINF